MSFWMLSEASDFVICYALLLRIKANVEKDESYTVCVITSASNSHLAVCFYSFNTVETQTGIRLSLSADISSWDLAVLCGFKPAWPRTS